MPELPVPRRLGLLFAGGSAAAGVISLIGALPVGAWLQAGSPGWHGSACAHGVALLAGAGALALLYRHRSPRARWTSVSLTIVFLALSLATQISAQRPGGLWQPGSLSAVLSAVSLLALGAVRLPRYTVAAWLGLIAANLVMLELIGHTLQPAVGMQGHSAPVAAGYLLLGVALIAFGPTTRIMNNFATNHPLRPMELRLAAAGVFGPIFFFALQTFWLPAETREISQFMIYSAAGLGVGLIALFNQSLSQVRRLDRLRRAAEFTRDRLLARLQQQAAELENKVALRTRSLDEANDRLTLVLHAGNFGVWDRDLQTGTLTWDRRQFELHGLREREFDGTHDNWLSLVHPADRPLLQELEHTLAQGTGTLDYTFRLLRPDGSIRYIEAHCTLQRDASGRPVRIVGMNRDITAEREQARAMAALHQRLQFVLNASGFGVWEFDPAQGILTCDDQLLRLYGLDRAHLRGGRGDRENLIHPDDLPAERALMDGLLKENRPHGTLQLRIVRSDGAVRHIETRRFLLRHPDGRPYRVIGFDSDVTEAHELRENLRLTEERWRLALSTNRDAVWDWNLTAGTIYRDERYADMLGLAASDLPPDEHVWRTRGHPDDIAAVEQAAQDHLEGRTPVFEREYRLRHADNRWIWVLVRGKVVARDPHGRPLRMTGTQTDVTARRTLEEMLRHGEEMSLQLSRLAQIGGWEWDVESSRLTWSPEMFRIHEVELGYEPTLPKALQFYPPIAQATFDEAMGHAMREGTEFDLELPFVTARGVHRHVRVRARAQIRDGRTVRIYGAFQDITDRHEAEQVRRKLESKLFQAQKMETLGTLAGGIAHDFNNLLTGILGYQELTLEFLPEDHQARTYLAASRDASLRARELVDQILTFSRQAGSEKVPVNLQQVIDDARRFLRSTVPANIAIEMHAEPGCPRAVADATQIHQVLLNLGSNSAHAMRATGGRITIRLATAELSHEMAGTLGNIAPGRYLRIAFSDTGHGMDEHTRKRIFDPFFTTKEVGQGTGLGLSVVHGIVEAHRGAIVVDSAPGQGATFTLYLPAAEEEPTVTGVEEATTPQGMGEMIAVVDDDDTVCRIVQLSLGNAGFRPVLFDTPTECLEAMRRDPTACSLLLTDQTMPIMRGIELAAEVRSFAPNLPVLIMSGYFSRISSDKLAQIGHVSLLPKPFTNVELVHAVSQAIRGGVAQT